MADLSIKDLAYRGLAAALGGPVDIATMIMRPFGYQTPDAQVFGGSEWIGQKMQDTGLVSSARNPLAELGASMVIPGPDDLARAAAFAPALVGSIRGIGKAEDVLTSINPTGTIFTKYEPSKRATQQIGANITTYDVTSNLKPDSFVEIYRGVPKGIKNINPGDFVTTNKQLAKDYAGNGTVITKRVRARELLDDITDPLGEEYIFRP